MRTTGLLVLAVCMLGGWTSQRGGGVQTSSAAAGRTSTLQIINFACDETGPPFRLLCSAYASGGTGPYTYTWTDRAPSAGSAGGSGVIYYYYGNCGYYPYQTPVSLIVQDSNGATAIETDTETGYCV
jgi:hypothetical protein